MKTKKELERSVMMLEDALQISKSNAKEYQEDLDLANNARRAGSDKQNNECSVCKRFRFSSKTTSRHK